MKQLNYIINDFFSFYLWSSDLSLTVPTRVVGILKVFYLSWLYKGVIVSTCAVVLSTIIHFYVLEAEFLRNRHHMHLQSLLNDVYTDTHNGYLQRWQRDVLSLYISVEFSVSLYSYRGHAPPKIPS